MIQENTKSLVQIHILPVFLNQKSWKYKKLLYHTKWLWNLARKFSKDRKDLLTFKFSSSKTVSQFTFHPALAEASKAIQQSTYKQLGLSAGCYQFVLPKFHYIGVCTIPPHSPHNLHFFPYFLSGVNCWRKMPPHFHIFTFSCNWLLSSKYSSFPFKLSANARVGFKPERHLDSSQVKNWAALIFNLKSPWDHENFKPHN